jgi:hypothetical protein
MPAATGIDRLVSRFPERAASIRELDAEDAVFRAICEDYGEALRALEHWSRSHQACARQRVDEYRMIVQELEAEVIAALDAHENR